MEKDDSNDSTVISTDSLLDKYKVKLTFINKSLSEAHSLDRDTIFVLENVKTIVQEFYDDLKTLKDTNTQTS